MRNNNQRTVGELESVVKEMNQNLRRTELEKEIKMLEAELNIGAVADKKNLILGLFDWYKTNYPHYELGDISNETIDIYLETIRWNG